MSDDLGHRGSPGNLMKAISRIIKLLEEIRDSLKQIANNKREDTLTYETSTFGEKPVQRYANRTGRQRGTAK